MLPEVLRTAKDLAVVAASQRTSVLHSEDHLLAVQDTKLGSAGQPFRILIGVRSIEELSALAARRPSYLRVRARCQSLSALALR